MLPNESSEGLTEKLQAQDQSFIEPREITEDDPIIEPREIPEDDPIIEPREIPEDDLIIEPSCIPKNHAIMELGNISNDPVVVKRLDVPGNWPIVKPSNTPEQPLVAQPFGIPEALNQLKIPECREVLEFQELGKTGPPNVENLLLSLQPRPIEHLPLGTSTTSKVFGHLTQANQVQLDHSSTNDINRNISCHGWTQSLTFRSCITKEPRASPQDMRTIPAVQILTPWPSQLSIQIIKSSEIQKQTMVQEQTLNVVPPSKILQDLIVLEDVDEKRTMDEESLKINEQDSVMKLNEKKPLAQKPNKTSVEKCVQVEISEFKTY